jgi:hypothetical protein
MAAPLFKLTCQDSGYLSGPLPKVAQETFWTLQTQLGQEMTLAFPRADQEYLLITNAYTTTTDLLAGLCATLAQKDEKGQTHIISHASRQLKENKKNYSPFLLETAAAVWGMDNFNEYLKGSQFTLYADPTPAPELGTTQMKTLNRLKTAMSEHKFLTEYCQKANLPGHLKSRQQNHTDIHHINNLHFNEKITLIYFRTHPKQAQPSSL